MQVVSNDGTSGLQSVIAAFVDIKQAQVIVDKHVGSGAQVLSIEEINSKAFRYAPLNFAVFTNAISMYLQCSYINTKSFDSAFW